MKYEVISRRAVCLLTDSGEKPEPETIAENVRTALNVCGYDMWAKMYIDLFPGLILARPENN